MSGAEALGVESRSTRRGSMDPTEFAMDYKFLKTLGEGSFGKVKLAVNIHTGEKVAVKILERKRLKKVEDMKRAQREIKVLTLVRHPHIAQMYEVVNTEKHIYLVLEHAPGGELFDYIVAHKRVREKEARVFFRQIVSAVAYCHANFFIHRDLKPENLLLDKDLKIKIIDFGFSNTFREDELMKTFCGSPAYAAPEMVMGEHYQGPAVDIWSLGVILFALVCGFLPFDDPNVNKLYSKIVKGKYKCPFFLSDSVKDLIGRMLVTSPDNRANMEEIMNHPWVLEGFSGPPETHLSPREPVTELDESAVEELEGMGFAADHVRTQVLANAPCLATSAYYLVLEKKEHDVRRAESLRAQLSANAHSRRSTRRGSALPSSLEPISESGGGGTSGSGSGSPRDTAPSATAVPTPLPVPRKSRRRHSIAVGVNGPLPTDLQRLAVGSPRSSANSSPSSADGSDMSPSRRSKSKSKDKSKSKSKSKDKGKGKGKDKGKDKVRVRVVDEAGASSSAAASTSAAAALDGTVNADGDLELADAAADAAMAAAAARAAAARSRGGRRFSLDAAMSSMSGKAKKKKSTPSGLRVVKGPFSVATTSSKSPEEMTMEVIRVLDESEIEYVREGFVFACETSANGAALRFEIEICKLERLALNGLRLKRVTGDTWAYKRQCLLLLSLLKNF